ncbi:MAG: F0F1 ATP synthase subunit epsilon [Bacteroidales bacterium]|nr:F0F1 ATP synthase subunit epsilon [Bacteroidales bacterium]
MKLQIITPGSVSEHDVEAVFLPGAQGSFEVLKSHAPIISTLVAGDVRWRSGGEESSFAVRGGAVMVENDIIKICAE